MFKKIFGCGITCLALVGIPLTVFGSSHFPCGIGWSSATVVCGPNRDADPGECFHSAGSGSCITTATKFCSDTDDFWCRSDDGCPELSTDEDSFCDTANYTTTTTLWYFDCPEDSGDGCGCVRFTNDEVTQAITYKALVAGTDLCAL